jgi:hypothetical protein
VAAIFNGSPLPFRYRRQNNTAKHQPNGVTAIARIIAPNAMGSPIGSAPVAVATKNDLVMAVLIIARALSNASPLKFSLKVVAPALRRSDRSELIGICCLSIRVKMACAAAVPIDPPTISAKMARFGRTMLCSRLVSGGGESTLPQSKPKSANWDAPKPAPILKRIWSPSVVARDVDAFILEDSPAHRAIMDREATRIYVDEFLSFLEAPVGMSDDRWCCFRFSVYLCWASITTLEVLLVLSRFSSSLIFFARRNTKGNIIRHVKRCVAANGRYITPDMSGVLLRIIRIQIAKRMVNLNFLKDFDRTYM